MIRMTLTERSPEWSPGVNLLVIAPTPSRISFKTAGRWATYNLLSPGPVEVKNGEMLSAVSWSGLWSSRTTRDALDIPAEDWTTPLAAINKLEAWRLAGTPIVFNIYNVSDPEDEGTYPHPFAGKTVVVKELDFEHAEGYGDIEYSISLQEYREIGVAIKAQEKTSLPAAPAEGILVKDSSIERITPALLARKYTGQYALADAFVAKMTEAQKVFLATNGYLMPGSYSFPDSWKQ